MLPGAMVTTRIPCLARSLAMGSVMPTTPALDAEYAACPIYTYEKNELRLFTL